MYETLNELPLLLTLTEVQKHVGLPKSTTTKWLLGGNPHNFPAQKIGGTWKVNRLKLAKWLEEDHSDIRIEK